MNKGKSIPLAERIQGLGGPDSPPQVESLEAMSRRIPFFFQGVAALTGMRCHRENLACWSRWERMEEERSGKPSEETGFLCWLAGGGRDLAMADDGEFFANLLLEPMHWLEECAKAQEYEE